MKKLLILSCFTILSFIGFTNCIQQKEDSKVVSVIHQDDDSITQKDYQIYDNQITQHVLQKDMIGYSSPIIINKDLNPPITKEELKSIKDNKQDKYCINVYKSYVPRGVPIEDEFIKIYSDTIIFR